MSIIEAYLRQQIALERKKPRPNIDGEAQFGPIEKIRCRWVDATALINDIHGDQITSQAQIFCRPCEGICVGDRVIYCGRTYFVGQVRQPTHLSGATHLQVYLI